MKNTSSMLVRIASFTGIALGAFALVAAAGTWTPPPQTAPAGNVDAPINVGSSAQAKVGGLRIGDTTLPTTNMLEVVGKALFASNIGVSGSVIATNVIATSTVTESLKVTKNFADNRVLTSDKYGNASWEPLPVATTPSACPSVGGGTWFPVNSYNAACQNLATAACNKSSCSKNDADFTDYGNGGGTCIWSCR